MRRTPLSHPDSPSTLLRQNVDLPSSGAVKSTGRPRVSSRPSASLMENDAVTDASAQALGAQAHSTTTATHNAAPGPSRTQSNPTSASSTTSTPKPPAASPHGTDLEKLKQAVNARIAYAHRVQTASPVSPTTIGTRLAATSPTPLAPWHLLPTAGPHSASTESTESTRTVRGSQFATPSQAPITPSYPFPYVPKALNRRDSPSFHVPFTALSPTSMPVPSDYAKSPRDRHHSIANTEDMQQAAEKDADDYPAPDLYNAILRLNSDPDFESWWITLARLMRECFKVDRMSLALPADPTDIENVPWGLKAAFNANGLNLDDFSGDQNEGVATSKPKQSPRQSYNKREDVRTQTKPLARPRPPLETRHSYSGQNVSTLDESPDRPKAHGASRPASVRRKTAQLPTMSENAASTDFSDMLWQDRTSSRPTSMSARPEGWGLDEETLGCSAGTDSSPQPSALVFPILYSLERDTENLLNRNGVIRVLDRGKLIALTREYQGSAQGTGPETKATTESAKAKRSPAKYRRHFSSSQTNVAPGTSLSSLTQYEEYEQPSHSPWAQSPAPSPAVQQESRENPFFGPGSVDEGSFTPIATSDDYARLGHVQAIGIDNASTIIHIPLIHPSQSRSMQSTAPEIYKHVDVAGETLLDRKAPVAILSILAPVVPYPHSLIHSLKVLSPHVATSFLNSFQYTDISVQLASALHRNSRREAFGHDIGLSLGLGAGNFLLEHDEGSLSLSGSLNSPSDYSGRSRYSPRNSRGGTPAWEVYGPKEHSTGNTPGTASVIETVDSYFDAKKRAGVSRSNSGVTPAHGYSQSSSSTKPSASKWSSNPITPGKDELGAPKKDAKLVKSRERANSMQSPQHEEFPVPGDAAQRKPPLSRFHFEPLDRKHAFLHSYGADFSASFQSLPVTAALQVPKPQVIQGFSSSAQELFDIPPPSESLLRTMMDALPVQIWLAHPRTGAPEWVNSRLLVYRGQTAREVLDNPHKGIHPEDLDVYLEEWQQSLLTGRQLQHKMRLRRFDGQYRWYYVRVLPLRDKRQNIVHWIGTCMDFHEQHMAEQKAAKQQETAASEAKYRALADSSPQIVFAATRNRGVTFCNTRWLDYSGQTEEEAIGAGFMDHVHPEDLAKCKIPFFEGESDEPTNVPITTTPTPSRTTSTGAVSNASGETNLAFTGSVSPSSMQVPQRTLSELAESGILRFSKDAGGKQSYSTEVRLRRKDGDYRWYLVRVLLAEKLLQLEDNEETWYGSCTDINDHKLLEKTLKETMDAKSRFLSNMSHEIRTPLNGIHGMVNFLIDSNLTPEQLDQVNVIRASTEGLRDLINDILDLSKVEAGMITLNMDWLHIHSVIEEVNDLTSTLALDKAIELNYLVEDNVPSMLKGDKFRIRQVLLNVIGNAIKFTHEGEVFIRCKLADAANQTSDPDSTMIQFDVVDTGRGFSEHEAALLFKRFSQIDGSSTRQYGGTGLGLAISMQLAELHGGGMTAVSTPGKGSTFTFSIRCGLPTRADIPPSVRSLSDSDISAPTAGSETVVMSPTGNPTRKDMLEPSTAHSSASSSFRSSHTSSASAGSSASSRYSGLIPNVLADVKLGSKDSIQLTKPDLLRKSDMTPTRPVVPGSGMAAPMFSILVLSSLPGTLEATVKHIETTLPRNIPCQITARSDLDECRQMLGGDDPILFTHVVLAVQGYEKVIALMDKIFEVTLHSHTILVIICDVSLKRDIKSHAPQYDIDQLARDRRLHLILKPLKPSKLAVIFDPKKEREMSTDLNQSSAQQIAVSQKQVFDETTRRLGNKNLRVLLVEDNRINLKVMLKLLQRVSIEVDTVLDGVECTEKIFSHCAGYYSIILCDLHMPRKDGYQTCRDIRDWERARSQAPVPMVALSANVLDNVYEKCAAAGFNSYLTKPVEFKELCEVMTKFLDPPDPQKPLEFMSPEGHG